MTETLKALLAGELSPALYRCSARVRAATITRLAERQGWRVYRLDGRTISDKSTFLSQVAGLLQFPSYFGHNWDAFEECLNDMVWTLDQPALLLFDHAGRFAAAEPEQFAMALDILAASAENRRAGPGRLVVLLQGAGRRAAHLPAVQL